MVIMNLTTESAMTDLDKGFLGYISVLCLTSGLLNGFVYVIVLYCNIKKLKPSHIVVLNLTTIDLCITLIYLPVLMYSVLYDTYTLAYCKVLLGLEKALFAGEMWSMALLSGDRYLFIVKHSRYKDKMTRKKTVLLVITMWIFIIMIGAITSVTVDHTIPPDGASISYCHISHMYFGFYNLTFTALYFTLCLVLPLTCIFVFYGFVIQEASTNSKLTNKNPFHEARTKLYLEYDEAPEPLPSPAISKQCTCQMKPVCMLIMLLCVHSFCSLPYFLINLITATSHQSLTEHFTFIQCITAVLMVTNSVANPVYYIYANKKLCSLIIKCLHVWKKRRPPELDTNMMPSECGHNHLSITMGSGNSSTRSSADGSPFTSQGCMYSAKSQDALMPNDLLQLYQSPLTETQACLTVSHNLCSLYPSMDQNEIQDCENLHPSSVPDSLPDSNNPPFAFTIDQDIVEASHLEDMVDSSLMIKLLNIPVHEFDFTE